MLQRKYDVFRYWFWLEYDRYSYEFITDKWSTGQKSEEEFKKYFDTNANNLHPIEGIWNISSSNKIVYRIAIVRYQPDTAYDYDYVGVLLMSSAGKEEPGLVKVEFRTLSQGGIMKAIWHYQDDTVGIKEFIQLNKDVIKDTGSDLVLSKTYPKT